MGAVWQGMTQAQLDAAYDQAAYAPNRDALLRQFADASKTLRDRIGAPRRFAYGTGAKEGMDAYSPQSIDGPAPVNVFIHGGAWRGGAAVDYGFPAEIFVNAGAHYVAIDFDWVQDRNGNLMPIADQVRRALAWVWRNSHRFGGDRDRIFASSHSSGAHLSGVALTTDWPAQYAVPQDIVKGALLCSGMYDMEPVRLSARSAYVSFTDESENALSAMRHLDKIATPVVVAYGTNETPEFQRQSQEFAAALKERHHPVELLVGDGLNHFEILKTLADGQGLLGSAALRQMGLADLRTARAPG